MGLLDRTRIAIAHRIAGRPYTEVGTHAGSSSGTPAVDNNPYYYFGYAGDVSMATLISYYETSPYLRSTVDMVVDHTVGNGYHLKADTSNTKGRRALDIVTRFMEQRNMGALNREIARDTILSGNWFGTPLIINDTGEFSGTITIPLSSITNISRDPYTGEITSYRQHATGIGAANIPAKHIIHFARNHIDGSAWGEGLGQMQCRPGIGYKQPNGKTVARAPWVRIWEMMADVSSKQFYQGAPRFMIALPNSMPPDERKKLEQLFMKLAPGQFVITSGDSGSTAKVETISLPTQGKFGDIAASMKEQAIISLQNPAIELNTKMGMTYASAREAMEAIIPGIRGYEADHARFVERNIIWPLLAYEFGVRDPAVEMPDIIAESGIEMKWGQASTMDIETILKAMPIIDNDKLIRDYVRVEDIFNLLNAAGLQLTMMSEEEAQQRRDERAARMPDFSGGNDNSENDDPNDTSKDKKKDIDKSAKSDISGDDAADTPVSHVMHEVEMARIKHNAAELEEDEKARRKILRGMARKMENTMWLKDDANEKSGKERHRRK